MLITKREVKQTSKKLLSVLLAVIMMMTSVSVCFGSIAFAAGGSATDSQWNILANALKVESVKNATFSGETNNYKVEDPDGTLLAAVEAYWVVLNALAKPDTKPATGNGALSSSSDSSVIGSDDGNLTINQIHDTMKSQLSSIMGGDYTNYKVAAFLDGLRSGANITAKGKTTTNGPDQTNNTAVPASDLSSVTVNLTVVSSSAVTNYTLEQLEGIDSIALEKTFTVTHKGDRYDYAYDYTAATSGCSSTPAQYKHTYTYFSYIDSTTTSAGSPKSVVSINNCASVLNTYSDYFTADMATLVSKGSTTLGTVKTAVNNAKSNVVTDFGEAVYTHFFSAYNVDTLNTNIANAQNAIQYIPIAREIKTLAATDYSAYDYSQLSDLYNVLSQKINSYNPNSVAAAYIATAEGFDLQAAKDELIAIDKEIKLIEIREAKVVIDAHMAQYNTYTTEQIDEGTLTAAAIGAAIAAIAGDISRLSGFNRAYVDEVCGADYFSKLNACDAHLDELAVAANYNDRFAEKYAMFAADIQGATDITLDDAALLEGLQSYDTWLTEFKALIEEMKSVLGEELANELFDGLNEPAIAHMEAGYEALKTKVETQVDDAYALFTAFLEAYPAGSVDFKNVSQYSAMKYSIGLINVDAYEWLPAAQNGASFSAETVRKYNELQREFPDFDAFIESMGFSEFKTTEIEDIVRLDTIEDIARKNENGEYVVDDEKVENVIGQLEALLQNEEIKSLLGSLINKDEDGNPTGEPFDLAAMLNNLIKGALFTDSFINTVIGMLYPLVVTEFIKVWANELPPSFHLDEIVIADLGFLGKIRVPSQDANISYDKNLYTVLKESPMNIFPDLLAGVLDSGKYADNIALLRQASSQFKTEFGATDNNYYTITLDDDGKKVADKTPWDSAALKKNVIDEETGEVKLDGDGNPVTEWALTWGVDDARAKVEAGEMTEAEFEEFFYQAFDDAAEGLKPLLLALIANKDWTNTDVTDMASLVIQDISVIGDTDVTVDLDLSATANRGYANLLVPVYEALGLSADEFTAPGTLESYANNTNAAADVLRAILTPVFTFVNKLGANPLDTLLGILPDICYVLMTQSVPKLLDMLKTTITYFGKPIGTGIPLIGELDLTTVSDAAKVEGGADISVGSMLDLKDMGVDLTDGLNSVLKGFGLEIPNIDQGKVATLGTLTTIDTQRADWIYEKPAEGKAYHIEANKADVLLYILDYALGSGLLNSFIEVPAEGFVADLFTALQENPDNIIAAVVELLNQEPYDTLRKYVWYNGTINGESVLGNSAYEIYLNPNNDWTKDKAEYLYNNIDALVASILTMAKLDLDKTTEEVDGSLGGVIGGAIGGLLSDKTLTALAALLAKLDLNALLAPKDEEGAEAPDANEPETLAEGEEGEAEAAPALDIDVNALIKEFLGIDLSAIAAQYADIAAAVEADEEFVYDFGVDAAEDKGAAFAAKLAEMLEPLSAVLDFILAGRNLTINLSETEKVELIGYNGYNNAIIPLLEALGCDVIASDKLETSELEATLNALLARIDALTKGDVIKNIIDLLPGVLYFIASKGLSVTVRNLLQPVYVILDTIRPIYDLDLNELINGLLPEDSGMSINIDDIGVEFIFDLLADLVPDLDLSGLEAVIYDVTNLIGTEYASASTLQADWKKGAYTEGFNQADMLTVVLSFVLEWATVEENAKALDELLKTDGVIASLNTVFADIKHKYGTPNWMYWFESEEAFGAYIESGEGLPNTLASLDWENITDNDWDIETAQYFANNLNKLVDLIIAMINEGKTDDEGNALPTNLADLLGGLVNGLVSAETLNELIGMITGLLGDIDENLINTAGYLLDVDLAGLKTYTCEAEINSISDFINELANVLDKYASGLINWLFFGDDYRFAKKSDNTDTIVINGGYGYEKGLAMILEALGCALPAEANTKSVLGALAIRVEEILADPIDEVLDLLPNLVYFLNANGAGVSVDNLLKPVNALLTKLQGFGLNVNLNDLIKIKTTDENGNEAEKALDLSKLSLANIVEIVEGATDLPLDAAEAILVDFCTGKITKGTYIYKMEAAREDVITILLVVALELISDDAFAAKLNEMLDTDIVTGIKGIFTGSEIIYKNPDWNYMNGKENAGVIEYVNAITSYPNDWTEEKAEYLAANLPALVDTVIRMVEINGVKYESLSALLEANVNIFTTETLNGLLYLIKNLLGNIDAELLKAGYIIDVDLAGLMGHTVPEGITTVDAFADELAKILSTYAKGAVEWLLLGRDFNLIVKDKDGTGEGLETDGSYITITGAQGYAEGLALLLEVLGCENLPEIYDVEALDTETTVKAVLASLAARIDEIFANPVEEVLDLLPNLIYFLDADGIDAVITNTTAALMALVEKLGAFGIELDINSLVNLPDLMNIADKYAENEEKIALDNLTLVALLKALSLMTDLDFTDLENVLVPFALGEAVEYDSVSASKAYKMVYKTEYDKHDMISVIVTAALRFAVENEENAAKLDKMLGTEIISALKDVFTEVEVSYVVPEWDYAKTGDGEYMLTYPNNWNEATAEYVAGILPELGDLIAGLIDSNYATLSALLNDKVNVFTTENLQSIVDLIADLLTGIDAGLLDAAGVLLGADVIGLQAYKAPEGITTVDAFASELANVLNTYAKGVVEWLLLGKDYKFFVKEVQDGAPVDFITINGANGYAEGLALLLEALGCENLPAVYDVENLDTEATVKAVLASLAARIDEIFANPVAEAVELLPNLIYFLNTNGVAAVVDNTIAAVTALLDKLEGFGINVDLNELVNIKKLMKIEDTDAAISLDNLTAAAILEAVSYMVENLDLTVIESVLVGFDLGEISEYASISKESGVTKKMTLSAKDTVTVLVNLVVLTISEENNAEFVEKLVGEKAYAVIENLCVKGVVPAEIQKFDWKLTEKADTDEAFSALATSELYKSGKYGPLYTEEMANYIADNFGEFVDNIIYLLGIQIIEGQNVDNFKDLINDLLGGSLYNSANIIAIRDALAGVLAGIKDLEVNGKNVGKYIAEVLKNAGIADINAVAKVDVPEFTENREMFVEYLCNVLEPLYPVLTWVLADDDIAFFVNPDSTDAIKLEGGKGYQYGIIPLLEVLECKDILAPADYYAAVEANGDVVLTSILDPLLDRVDEIINNDPAQQILDMLPNLIYFINSNGVDTVVKNTLHAVYGLLSAIAPIAEIDLYELIGIDLAEIDFEWLFNKLLEIIKDATGYEFSTLDANALVELTVGKLESYNSLSGETAYKMVYVEGESGNKGEMVTVVMRLVVTFIMHENNREALIGLLKDYLGMNKDAEKYVRGVLDSIASISTETYLGMDQALATLYYLFYGADIGVGSAAGGLKDLNAEWQAILKELGKSDNPDELTIGNILAKFLNKYMEDILTEDGVAPNGFIAFFQKIIDWFNKIVEWFKNLFN